MSQAVLDATDLHSRKERFCSGCWKMLARPQTSPGKKDEFRRDPDPGCELCALMGNQLGREPKMGAYQPIKRFAMPGDPAAAFVSVPQPPIDLTSEAVFIRAREWLRACRASHKPCRVTDAESGLLPLLPTRVIDVGGGDGDGDGDGGNGRVLLHASGAEGGGEGGGERGEYACLSYRWGGDQFKTLRGTLAELMTTGVAVDRLSRTVADAVEVTRRLGLRYLWVDALCIVQDDDADKAREIVKMDIIYKNATVTIAADTAGAASEGFLRSPAPFFPSVAARVTLPNGEVGTLRFTLTNFYDLTRMGNPALRQLDMRGWCLQEALLSPRRLVFAGWGVKMLCQYGDGEFIAQTPFGEKISAPHRALSDKGGPWVELRLPPGIFGGESMRDRLHKVLISDMVPYSNRLDTWKDIVTEFSIRQLQYAEDRLAALAGIASELQRVWADEYMFGLWRSMLLRTLVWWAHWPGRRLTAAPTWSCDSRIAFQRMWRASPIDVDDAHDDDDVAAAVKEAAGPSRRLVLSGTLIRPSDGPFPAWMDSESYEVWYDTDEVLDDKGCSFLVVKRDTRGWPDSEAFPMGNRRVTTTYLVLRRVDDETYARVGLAMHTQKYRNWRDPDSRWSELSKGPKVRVQLE